MSRCSIKGYSQTAVVGWQLQVSSVVTTAAACGGVGVTEAFVGGTCL